MYKKIKITIYLASFTFIALSLLFQNQAAVRLALEALNLWFNKMIPALFPFMILSGLLINLNLSDRFASIFSPILRPIYRLSDFGLYCIIIGFLCGFPMGARVCAQQYERGNIGRKEATLLLAFCNNIGPIYFTGFVLQLFPTEYILPYLFGMYGIPLVYGFFLRYTSFSDVKYEKKITAVHTNYLPSLFTELNHSIQTSLDAVTVLGGYMIFCNILNLIPIVLIPQQTFIQNMLGPVFEITSGLSNLPFKFRKLAFILLHFGGISCIAQTSSCIRNTDLSLREYVFHKSIQTILAAAYYGFII